MVQVFKLKENSIFFLNILSPYLSLIFNSAVFR